MKTKLLVITIFISLIFLFSFNTFSGPRNITIEFSTGTWCGFCPCGERIADSILVTYPNTVVIGYHSGGNDPFVNFPGTQIFGMMGYTASPTACINRMNHPGNSTHPYMSRGLWKARVTELYTTMPTSSVDIVLTAKNYNSTTRELSVTLNATASQTLTGQYKIHYIITEDNVVYVQNHYPECGYNGYDSNYVHKWIPRAITNGVAGEILNSGGVWNQNQTFTKNMSYILGSTWNANNCKFLAIVYKDSSEGIFASVVQQAVKQLITQPLGISNEKYIPEEFSLSQNYPNPFNPTTNIKFSLPQDTKGSLKIYDMLGNVVAVYFDGFMKAGSYNAEVDAGSWASGVYFYKLSTPEFTQTKKMMLIK
ncbi:MAG: T9SS C-terminal target domain-containing protein [Ignavibacteriae bacterium]|nr:MAG: T9SS C-terminal target domain-containing protein [Ignavibacteriota bacterium]